MLSVAEEVLRYNSPEITECLVPSKACSFSPTIKLGHIKASERGQEIEGILDYKYSKSD